MYLPYIRTKKRTYALKNGQKAKIPNIQTNLKTKRNKKLNIATKNGQRKHRQFMKEILNDQ